MSNEVKFISSSIASNVQVLGLILFHQTFWVKFFNRMKKAWWIFQALNTSYRRKSLENKFEKSENHNFGLSDFLLSLRQRPLLTLRVFIPYTLHEFKMLKVDLSVRGQTEKKATKDKTLYFHVCQYSGKSWLFHNTTTLKVNSLITQGHKAYIHKYSMT